MVCYHRASVVALTLIILGQSAARAAPRYGHHDLRFNFGVASPVGFFGVTYGYRPLSALELEAGVGWGYSGLQSSLMAKLIGGSQAHNLVLAAGASASVDPGNRGDPRTYTGLWLNAEAGYCYRSRGHWSLLVAAGITSGLAGQMHEMCVLGCDTARDGRGVGIGGLVLPQVRLASGWWF